MFGGKPVGNTPGDERTWQQDNNTSGKTYAASDWYKVWLPLVLGHFAGRCVLVFGWVTRLCGFSLGKDVLR